MTPHDVYDASILSAEEELTMDYAVAVDTPAACALCHCGTYACKKRLFG
jgi:hypothetical protein